MKRPSGQVPEPARQQGPSPWRGAWPELAVACIATAASAIAGYAVAGTGAAVLVVVVFSVLGLAVLSTLLPSHDGLEATPEAPGHRAVVRTAFMEHWRMRRRLTDATASLGAYRAGLGPDLQHVLAARLAERYGVSLYSHPDVARGLFCAKPGHAHLWAWVDPARPETGEKDRPGIPLRTLARLVQRLEQL